MSDMQIDLSFSDFLSDIKQNFLHNGYLTVYDCKESSNANSYAVYGCFVNNKKYLEVALNRDSWDLTYGSNGPTILETRSNNNKYHTKYYPKASKDVDHFIIYRQNFPNEKTYLEVSEEFRLYYNLYEKRLTEETDYIYFDSNGDEQVIVRVKSNNYAEVKYSALIDFISTKKNYFSLQFDIMRFSKKSIFELSLDEKDDFVQTRNYCYSLLIRDDICTANKAQAWLMGKYIIYPQKNYKVKDFYPLDTDNEKYADFIYGFDENGEQLSSTCDENELANYFGANPDKLLYTTPVYFKKDVLKKYYELPEKYSVEDGFIRCGSAWYLRIDNSCKDYVVAMLGDLGKLAYKEQLYWKSFNIEQQDGMSITGFLRAYGGVPANPQSPDLFFKMSYKKFIEDSYKQQNDCILKPLNKDDMHYFTSLHVMLEENNEKEFDEQILSLTKILIDSINEKYIKKKLTEDLPDDSKGISKLEKYLTAKGLKETKNVIDFLRNLQQLRSTTVAHRRSDNNKQMQKAEEYFEIGKKSDKDVLDNIFNKATSIIYMLKNISNI